MKKLRLGNEEIEVAVHQDVLVLSLGLAIFFPHTLQLCGRRSGHGPRQPLSKATQPAGCTGVPTCLFALWGFRGLLKEVMCKLRSNGEILKGVGITSGPGIFTPRTMGVTEG